MTKDITKHAGGRPTKYIPEDIYPLVEEYIQMCGKEQMELPTIEGLALKLSVNPDTLYEWRDKYPEFSETLKKILAKQKIQLMNDGMYGGKEINSGMAIFLLKANHNMSDGPAVQVNTQNNTIQLSDEQLKRIIGE